ncbi:putative oxidoreductase subunit with NAD(P)-binding domain and ferridoxin-like domain [Desulfosarcina cetonica]|nr:putative oxidoreductase subunit with NAD(P)-binding domain and ferridoxin-like domain [Desulfosarcina cetonica]
MATYTTDRYVANARTAIDDPILQQALSGFQHRMGPATAETYRQLPEGPGLRDRAHAIRQEAIDNLDILLETLADNVRRQGGQVFFAASAEEAVAYCLAVARRHEVKRVVKGKSMVTEEVGLNEALAAEGIEVNETDLGEYIIQLAGERPSHIIAPAIHKTREQVGRLFADKLGIAYTDDPPSLTQAARKALREKFLTADMGVTGCNLACAETGHITTVSNEGNIRMSSTLPRVHVAFMGMERVVARLEDHDILFRLLSRGAAAQRLGGYVSYVGGPGGDTHPDGPREFHLIIIDNGRSRILADPAFREMLCCIRCSACLNVCPVYGKIGGHAYGSPYSGPVGAVVTPLLIGLNKAKDLCMGESLCGACKDACPVNIDLPRMLRELRARISEGDARWKTKPAAPVERLAFSAWAWMTRHPAAYRLAMRLGAAAQSLLPRHNGLIRRLPGPVGGWTRTRDLRPINKTPFRQRFATRRRRA